MAGLEEGRAVSEMERSFRNNRRTFVDYLRSSDCAYRMLEKVEGFDKHFCEEVNNKERYEGSVAANETFLRRLEDSPDPNKWEVFRKVLLDTNYQKLYDILMGNFDENTRLKSNVKEKRFFQQLHFFADKINTLELLPFLRGLGCINELDYQNVKQETDNFGNIRGAILLLNRITRLKENWCEDLVHCLLQTGKGGLVPYLMDMSAAINTDLVTEGTCIENKVLDVQSGPGGDLDKLATGIKEMDISMAIDDDGLVTEGTIIGSKVIDDQSGPQDNLDKLAAEIMHIDLPAAMEKDMVTEDTTVVKDSPCMPQHDQEISLSEETPSEQGNTADEDQFPFVKPMFFGLMSFFESLESHKEKGSKPSEVADEYVSQLKTVALEYADNDESLEEKLDHIQEKTVATVNLTEQVMEVASNPLVKSLFKDLKRVWNS